MFDETHAYAPPARRFFVTGSLTAEVDNYENRGRQAAIPVIPPVILGAMARVSGSLERAFIAADFVFPALLFVLLFALGDGLNLSWRLLVAWSTLIVSFGILNCFWLGEDALIAPLEFTRTPQPELSFLVVLAAAAMFARSIEEKGRWKSMLAAGLLSGAVVYCYYFYTIAWGAGLFFAFVLGLLWRRRLLWTHSLTTLAIMAVLGVPYVLAGLHSPGQADLLGRVGVFTHDLRVIPLLLALFAAALTWYLGRTRLAPLDLVLMLLVVGALAGMNIQLLTGYETQPWHFWKRLAVPAAFFLVSATIARRVQRMRHSQFAAAVLLIALLADTAARLSFAALQTAPYQRSSDARISLLKWVDGHLPGKRVIGTVDPRLILLIPAITIDYTYVPSGLRSLTPTEEIEQRYYQMACLLCKVPAEVESAVAVPNHLGRSTEVLYALGLNPGMFRGFVDGYRNAYARCQPTVYRLDYVIVSSDDEQRAVQRQFANTRELYRNAHFRVIDLAR